MNTLIERLRERAKDPRWATDEWEAGTHIASPPLAERQIVEAEVRLGFQLPLLLRQVYREVGDGGFGPGPGLLSLADIAEVYSMRRKEQTAPAWPKELIPICDWGSGITSLIDCTQSAAPIIRLDPNMPKSDVTVRVPQAMHFTQAKQVKDACWVEASSLQVWLEAWTEGKRLFYAAYSTGSEEEIVEDEEDEADDDIDIA